jgi:hypothetical protein
MTEKKASRAAQALADRRTAKSEEIPPVVIGSPAHKIIGATSVDFGARRRAA